MFISNATFGVCQQKKGTKKKGKKKEKRTVQDNVDKPKVEGKYLKVAQSYSMLFHRTWSVGRRSTKNFGTRIVAVRNSSSTDLHEAGSRIPQLVKPEAVQNAIQQSEQE